jgi:predicted small metal-binding protein
MTRRMIDCRDWPGPCTLAISGQEAEVVEAQAQHMVHVHGATDGAELREQIRVSLKDAREEALA